MRSWALAIVCAWAACKGQDKEGNRAEAPKRVERTTAPASVDARPIDAVAIATPEAIRNRDAECWNYFSYEKDAAKLATCFTANVTMELVDSGIADTTTRDELMSRLQTLRKASSPYPEIAVVDGHYVVRLTFFSGALKTTLPRGALEPTDELRIQTVSIAHYTDDGRAIDKLRFLVDLDALWKQREVLKKGQPHGKRERAWDVTLGREVGTPGVVENQFAMRERLKSLCP